MNSFEFTHIFPFDSSVPFYEIELQRGKYLFELWGAQGGDGNGCGGKGSFTSGIISIFKPTSFLIYVGGKGDDGGVNIQKKSNGGYNGGGKGGAGGAVRNTQFSSGAGGGGATDIRLNDTLESRIIVAGGGGGTTHACDYKTGGYGGGIVAGPDPKEMKVANQTYGYQLGVGQDGRDGVVDLSLATTTCNGEGGGGAGGGYFGGFSYQGSEKHSNAAGGGGSSYISGHPKCAPFLDYYFTHPKILTGNEEFLSPSGENETGHSGDGYARIICIDALINTNYQLSKFARFSFAFIFIVTKV